MNVLFFDSSAIGKRYMPEAGTAQVLSLTARTQRNRILVAQITSVEVLSALARRRREGTLSTRTTQAARLLLYRHLRREYDIIYLTDQITQHAGDLLDRNILRAYDAIQLASAIIANNRLLAARIQPLIFLSADTRLLNAAIAEGLQTENPELFP